MAKGKARRGSLSSVILAAGKGTRMRSAHAKVLHQVLGRPMAEYPVRLARELGSERVVVVLGHQREVVEATLTKRLGGEGLDFVEQKEQRGTGHALRTAMPALKGATGIVLVLYGDVPLLRRETLSALVGTARRYDCLALVTATPPDPTGYGRVLRDSRGHVVRIVEHKDASDEERLITEVNAGIYAGPIEFFRDALARLQAGNAQGEYYLTDVVERAAGTIGVSTVEADYRDVAGVNDRRQLAEADARMRARVTDHVMVHATVRDPSSTTIEPDVTVGVDAELAARVTLRGTTRVGRGARIGEGSVLIDTEVGPGAEVLPYTVAQSSVIGADAHVGPFAHLRPGTVLGPRVKVGNFVEMKKTTMGAGSKANHLSYVGDATVGRDVNIGAGTITCNYNGFEKRQTIIEDGAFIGSDSQLVAPVTVGRRAVIAAGTTVVRDVPAGSLGIARAEQVAVSGYAQKLADRYADRPGKNGKATGKATSRTSGKGSPASASKTSRKSAGPRKTGTKAKGASAAR